MRFPLTVLIGALLLSSGCDKKQDQTPSKVQEKATDKGPDKASNLTLAKKPALPEEKKKAILAELTCPPGTETKTSAWKDSGVKYCVRPDGKQHGMTVEMYTNTKEKWPLKMAGNWKDGRRDGEYNWWHKNGAKKEQGAFKEGKRTGPWLEWHQNKNKALESNYKDGLLHGVWKKWEFQGGLTEEGKYDRGKVVGTWTFSSGGGKELARNELGEAGTGPWKKWSALSKLLEEGAYLNGMRDGTWVVYHSYGGSKKEEGKYAEGKKTGKWTEYRGMPSEYEEGKYKDGKRAGKWVGWGTTLAPGKGRKRKKAKTKEEFYRDGKLMGKATKWQYGKLSSVTNYKDGLRHGKSTLYGFGKRSIQDTYANGRKEGWSISWDSNGKSKFREGNFKAGKPCGKWKCYYRGRKTKCMSDRSNLPKCK